MASYDADADTIFANMPDGEYEIVGFRGKPATVKIKRVPVITMSVNDKDMDISTMMPKVRFQIAERTHEAWGNKEA